MAKITKDMLITDILAIDPIIATLLMSEGMHCVGCFASAGETLEEAAMVHGIDSDNLVEDLNDFLEHREEIM